MSVPWFLNKYLLSIASCYTLPGASPGCECPAVGETGLGVGCRDLTLPLSLLPPSPGDGLWLLAVHVIQATYRAAKLERWSPAPAMPSNQALGSLLKYFR